MDESSVLVGGQKNYLRLPRINFAFASKKTNRLSQLMNYLSFQFSLGKLLSSVIKTRQEDPAQEYSLESLPYTNSGFTRYGLTRIFRLIFHQILHFIYKPTGRDISMQVMKGNYGCDFCLNPHPGICPKMTDKITKPKRAFLEREQ